MDESDREITFGVEMKFLFALENGRLLQQLNSARQDQLSPTTPDIPTEEDLSNAVWRYIAYIVNRYRLGEYCPGAPRLTLDAEFVRHPQAVEFNRWNITTDDTLFAENGAEQAHMSPAQGRQLEWVVRGAELVSPILDLSDLDTVTLLLERIERVLLDHEQVFWPHHDRYGPHKAFVNDSCSLHVHLAYKNQEIPLETLKNLMTIWALFEDSISLIHSEDWLRIFPPLLHRFPNEIGRKLLMKAIRTCTNPDQLMSYFRPLETAPKDGKIRLTDFDNPTEGFKVRTIEFREHEGTLDVNAIRWWILFTSGVLRFAQALTDANLVFDVAGDVGITDLFELIQFPREGQEFYAKRIVGHQRRAGRTSAYWSQDSLAFDWETTDRSLHYPHGLALERYVERLEQWQRHGSHAP